jgi:hypothetical protein
LLKKECKERRKFKANQPKGRPERSNFKIEGIEENEVRRRKEAGECLRCAWPSDRKGTHWVKDCIRPIKLDKGTATFPKEKAYAKITIVPISNKD